jgi:hypothetical protein
LLLGRSKVLRLGIWWGGSNKWNTIASRAKGSSKSVAFLILLTRFSWSGVQAPLGLEGLVNFLGLGELKVADLFGDGSALSNRLEPRNKFGLEPAGLLRVQVTGFLWNIQE